ncbi:MAG: gluconate 2-dehydrogenase subunit 3 family protein, partial [Janthinobacterium sp.]
MIDSDEELQRLAGEYVLGTLELAERAAVEQRLPREPALRDAVDAWEQRLLPLTTLAPPEAPSAQLWPRISASLFTPKALRQAGGWQAWWNSLAFWRVLAGGGLAMAVSKDQPAYKPRFFDATEWATLSALVDRLIPADGEGPGALEAGAHEFIDLQMNTPYAYGALWYMQGPFVPSIEQFGYQFHMAPRELYKSALAGVNAAVN